MRKLNHNMQEGEDQADYLKELSAQILEIVNDTMFQKGVKGKR